MALEGGGLLEYKNLQESSQNRHNMSNGSDRDEIPNNDQIPQAATILGEETLTTGEQSAATPGTRAVNETLQHFHTALVNLVNEANKIGLTLPIGLGASSPYELTANALGNHPTGRLRSEVHAQLPAFRQNQFRKKPLRIRQRPWKKEGKGREKVCWTKISQKNGIMGERIRDRPTTGLTKPVGGGNRSRWKTGVHNREGNCDQKERGSRGPKVLMI